MLSAFSSPPPFILSFTLLLSIPILFLITPRIFPPYNLPEPLPDDPDDIDLLRRAASPSVSSFKSRLGTLNPTPKIAFLFLTNSDLHFSPLWERFFEGHNDRFNIYIHADPFSPFSSPGGVFENRLIPSKRTWRASPTLISATRRLLAEALLDDPTNAFFAMLSQHCIPLHSFTFFYKTLFLRSKSNDSEIPPLGMGIGQRSFIEILSKSRHHWERYTARGRRVMMPEVPFKKFRVGSQFFVLTRLHARTVVRDHRLWRKFRLPCLNTDSCYPEEHYFPTLLAMEDLKGCTGYTLTRVNWTDSTNGHPYTYRPSEVSPELIYLLRQSNYTEDYIFSRKFAPDCLQPLMKISDSVIFKD